MPASTSTCAAPARCRPMLTTALARVAAQHNLARLTRHGELIAQARAADAAHRQGDRAAAAGRLLAGDRGGRSDLGAAGARLVRRRRKSSPTCSAGIGPFALRLAERARVACRRRRRSRARRAQARRRGHRRPQAGRSRAARSVQESAARSTSSTASTPSCSIRRARAPRRKRASSRQAPFRAIVAVSCNPATFARDMRALARRRLSARRASRRSINSAMPPMSRSSRGWKNNPRAQFGRARLRRIGRINHRVKRPAVGYGKADRMRFAFG